MYREGCGVWKKLSGRVGKKNWSCQASQSEVGKDMTKVATDSRLITKVGRLAFWPGLNLSCHSFLDEYNRANQTRLGI